MAVENGGVVLILGSGPSALQSRPWSRSWFTDIVAINNAWRIRDDWSYLIHPEDFPEDRQPKSLQPGQRIVTAKDYVPLQNELGGFVYAGGTMAFTAAYWALAALKPSVLAFWGCDMIYPAEGRTHFYGEGSADPLRNDITLRNLEAKSARLGLLAALRGCACVNLSNAQSSRLVFPRASLESLSRQRPITRKATAHLMAARQKESDLDYMVTSGRYWTCADRFDSAEIDALDQLWLAAWHGVETADVTELPHQVSL